MMEASIVSKDTGWVFEESVIMWLGENTVHELYSAEAGGCCKRYGEVGGMGGGGGPKVKAARAGKTDAMTHWLINGSMDPSDFKFCWRNVEF